MSALLVRRAERARNVTERLMSAVQGNGRVEGEDAGVNEEKMVVGDVKDEREAREISILCGFQISVILEIINSK
jgi:hypothetical protein